MAHYDDDDRLIAGAFAAFDDAAAPTMHAVGTAPLHTKAIRARRTRATILGVAAAVLIALPVATYAALAQDNQGPPPIPGESAVPSPAASPSPVPSPSPSPDARPQSPFSVAYFAVAVNDKVEVYSYTDGEGTLKATISDPHETVRATLTVSPDESSLAWVEDTGALTVAGIDGLQKRTVLTGVAKAGMDAPRWTTDSKALVTQGGTIDVVTGKLVSATALGGHYEVIAPGGRFTAYSASSGPSRVVVMRADGGKFAEIPTGGEKSVLSLSPDGRYVALGGWPTAGERETGWREIVDTTTGRTVLDLGRTQGPKPGRFLADGTFLLHDGDKLKLMKVDGTVINTSTMPGALTVHNGPPAVRYPQLLMVK